MPYQFVLYASTSLLPPERAAKETENIVALARPRNAALDVTGALLLGDSRFAQVLEGPPAAVAAIMERVRRDPRHTDIVILDEHPTAHRLFAEWAMGYAGPSIFVARTIARPIHEATLGSTRGVADLIRLMREFASEHD